MAEANVDFISMALRRHGVREFPPQKHGALSDNPETEVWNIEPGMAESVAERARELRRPPQDIVRAAVLDHFRLPLSVGEEDFSVLVDAEPPQIVIGGDHQLADIMKAIALARGHTHLAVLDSCLRDFLQPTDGPSGPPRGPGPNARMRVAVAS